MTRRGYGDYTPTTLLKTKMFKQIVGEINQYGITAGIKRFMTLQYVRNSKQIVGKSIFSRSWDVCVILDACRRDELIRQKTNFEWIENVGSFPSVASCTWNWMPRTIKQSSEEELSRTSYVCANPFSNQFCTESQFCELDQVWQYAWDESKGTVLPRTVTDRAIYHAREHDPNRLLVHYLQPHVPFLVDSAGHISRNNFNFDQSSHIDDWDRVTRGELNRQTAILWYRKTLEKVLEEVELLLLNIDADTVVITSDHGEAFGEWGLYGHPSNVGIPALTHVPWLKTSAEDTNTYNPVDRETTPNQYDYKSQLASLGYKS